MKLIAEIREKDIYPEREELPDEAHINGREVAKIVLFDDENNLALVHYPPKEQYPSNHYYLPGGGVDEGEDIETALRREAKEETGCLIKDIGEVGVILEYMKEKLLKQTAYIFTAKVKEKGERVLTKKEVQEGMELVWKPLDEALSLVGANQVPDFGRAVSLAVLKYIEKKHK